LDFRTHDCPERRDFQRTGRTAWLEATKGDDVRAGRRRVVTRREAGIRGNVSGHAAVYAAARPNDPALATYGTIADVLTALARLFAMAHADVSPSASGHSLSQLRGSRSSMK
jgi:hypothetical protein